MIYGWGRAVGQPKQKMVGVHLPFKVGSRKKKVAVAHLLTFKAVGALHHLKVGLYLTCGPPLPAIDARPPAANNLVES